MCALLPVIEDGAIDVCASSTTTRSGQCTANSSRRLRCLM